MPHLLGRSAELRALRAAVAAARAGGAGVFLHGEPGIGKSALLEATIAAAGSERTRTLVAVGVPSERHLAYAALHQLLQPLLGAPAPGEPVALVRRAVLGAGDPGPPPEPVAVALAALELLRHHADEQPLLLAVEDVQWLDPSTAQVLAFIARRVADDPVVVLCTSREPLRPPLADVPFEVLELPPLHPDDIAALVRREAGDLHPVLRDRLVREAHGNPLAVVELARAWRRLPDGALVTVPVPLTERVEAAFAGRVDELAPGSRTLLLLAALHEPGTADAWPELVAAARVLGHDVEVASLAPAVDAGLVATTPRGVTFRHPLVRSAVHSRAGSASRLAAHAALADVAADPDRAARHRAAAATAPEESVARALDRSADRARRRGAVLESVTTLELAAAHSPDPAARGGRLVRAAYDAADLGHDDAVVRLLDEADALPLDTADRARAAWLRYRPQDVVGDYDRMRQLVHVLGELHAAGQTETALGSLAPAADIAFWRGVEPRCRDLFCSAVDRLTVRPEPRVLTAIALTAPVSRSQTVRSGIAALGVGAETDPETLALLGRAASVVGDVAAGTAHLGRAIGPLRAQGRLGLLSASLATFAWNCWHLGRWPEAEAAAWEVRDLARARERTTAAAVLMESLLRAVRGDAAEALGGCDAARPAVDAVGSRALATVAGFVRGTALLVLDRTEEAYELARAGFDEVDALPESIASLLHGTLPLYVDAALRVGAVDAARVDVDRLRPTLRRHGSPLLAASVTYADAVLADEGAAEPALLAAIDGLAGWPFLRARARLAHGRWLRRQRRVAESRAPLRTARDAFDALGAVPWATAARRELRATGVHDEPVRVEVVNLMTAQEREIAVLAAQGLTNREIGHRLFLSPRTVGSHLYHVFPKLGVASRAELARVLGPVVDGAPGPT